MPDIRHLFLVTVAAPSFVDHRDVQDVVANQLTSVFPTCTVTHIPSTEVLELGPSEFAFIESPIGELKVVNGPEAPAIPVRITLPPGWRVKRQ